MADSTFTITLTISGATPAAADAKRDAVLVDFAKSMNLDIYTDATRTTVDPAKVAPAVRASIKAFIKERVVKQRADAARSASATTEDANLGSL